MTSKRTHTYENRIRQDKDKEAIVVFDGSGPFAFGPPPEFGGRPESLNPEQLFVAAINGCLLTTLSYFLQRSRIELQSYQAQAEGQVQKGPDGFRFVGVVVRAKAIVKDVQAAEKASELAAMAEKYCLVSRSVSCPVHYDLHVEIGEEED
jgi:organic hydroperoxide reductase OsmC/OhrA